MQRGKKYTNTKKTASVEPQTVENALKQVASLSTSTFPGKIEVHISLNVNQKERKQPIRGNVTYQKPVGKQKKVLVFADPLNQDVAKKAGADYYGLEDLITKIKDGWIDFDVAIAIPSVMPKIAALGRVLGTKGLMPNPKTGTVTEDIEAAVASYKGGKIDFKSDETGVIHSIIGTTKSSPAELNENMIKITKAILASSGKQQNAAFKSIYVAPTMGPSIKVDIDSLLKEL